MLKYIFILILVIHGFIHFIGFSKAFEFGKFAELTKEITRPIGMLWFVTGSLFILTLLFLLFKKDSWPYLAISSAVLSQILILNYWYDVRFGPIANVIILLVTNPKYLSTMNFFNFSKVLFILYLRLLYYKLAEYDIKYCLHHMLAYLNLSLGLLYQQKNLQWSHLLYLPL